MYFKKRELIQLQEILGRRVAGIDFTRHIALSKLMTDWHRVVGKKIAAHATPLVIKSGRLLIGVDSSIWMNELMSISSTLLDRIKTTGLALQEIRFVLRRSAFEQPLGMAEPSSFPTQPTVDPRRIEQFREHAASIDDPELRAMLERVFVRHEQRLPR